MESDLILETLFLDKLSSHREMIHEIEEIIEELSHTDKLVKRR